MTKAPKPAAAPVTTAPATNGPVTSAPAAPEKATQDQAALTLPTGQMKLDAEVAAVKALASAEVPHVAVMGPTKGRWRIGRHFSPMPTLIALADLAEGDLERLTADPELVVVYGNGTT